jgi:hypothetical protein
MEINWVSYEEKFPERYWLPSQFDLILESWMEKHATKEMSLLDVGCGVHGTKSITRWKGDNWFALDPFVPTPVGYQKASWPLGEAKFDTIVLRGSLNYLTKEQLLELGGALKEGGALLANTFLTKPDEEWRSRPYVDGRGISGVESSRCVSGVVQHQLVVEGEIINHTFFYYDKTQLEDWFKGLKFLSYGKGSSAFYYGALEKGLESL